MKNVAESKIVLVVVIINVLAYAVLVINGIVNAVTLSVGSFASILVISLTSLTNDLYQYNNSNMPKLDGCRLFGMLSSSIMLVACISLYTLLHRLGFDQHPWF